MGKAQMAAAPLRIVGAYQIKVDSPIRKTFAEEFGKRLRFFMKPPDPDLGDQVDTDFEGRQSQDRRRAA